MVEEKKDSINNDDQFFIERLKSLRAKFEYKIDMLGLKTIVITSAIAGEGKSIISRYLAMNLATTGRKRTLLVDLDLRKPDIARQFGIPSSPGLSDFLQGRSEASEIFRNHVHPSLFVIPGGRRIESPIEFLSGGIFRDFLKNIHEKYDVILFDTPPVLAVSDALALKGLVDSFLFVFRADHTPYKLLQQAIEEVGENNIFGVVMNGVGRESNGYYKRYYGPYYHAYREKKNNDQ